MCALIFLYNFRVKRFSFEEELSEIWSKCILVFVFSARYSCPILKKIDLSRLIFEKFSNIKCTKIRPVEAELLHGAGGQKDRGTEANSRFSYFCELS